MVAKMYALVDARIHDLVVPDAQVDVLVHV
jgi:hypothetical protein